MKNTKTHEVPFLHCVRSGHLMAVRAGVARDEAIDHAVGFLDTAHGLMLVAAEVGSDDAATAAIMMVEMAKATLDAVRAKEPKEQAA